MIAEKYVLNTDGKPKSTQYDWEFYFRYVKPPGGPSRDSTNFYRWKIVSNLEAVADWAETFIEQW